MQALAWARMSLFNGQFDLLVIGGGIHGAFAAWDAALRGLRVALIERGDFGGATSGSSMRIAHGGFRYLQHADLARMRSSIRSRTGLLRAAPHLVHPLASVMPTEGKLLRSAPALRIALAINNFVAFDRNRGVDRPFHLPRGRLLSRTEFFELAGDLAWPRATGGALWYDAFLDQAERLVLGVVLGAADAGAVVANYVTAESLIVRNGRVLGVQARAVLSDAAFPVRARSVLDATGPWVGRLAHGMSSAVPAPMVRSSNVVIRRTGGEVGVAIPLHGEARMLFAVPWQDHIIVGTTQQAHVEPPDDLGAGAHDAEELCRAINRSLPELRLGAEEISLVHTGLVPANSRNPDQASETPLRTSRVVDHADEGLSGLVSMLGVKWTTARDVAARAVDLCLQRLGLKAGRSETFGRPVHGGDFTSLNDLLKSPAPRDCRIAPASLDRLRRLYGTAHVEVLAIAEHRPLLASPLVDGSAAIGAEVVHALRNEYARRLEDIVVRRLALGNAGYPGDESLAVVARLAAEELGWSEATTIAELSAVTARYPRSSQRTAAAAFPLATGS